MKQLSFFPEKSIYHHIDKMGDPLAKLDAVMDWTPFVAVIDAVRPDKTIDESGRRIGGRPPIESIKLFKCLMLGEFYNLSDASVEYQVNDRMSFKRFVGLTIEEKSPDANSIWLLKEALKSSGKYDALFEAFWDLLNENGIEYSKGAITDATFVDAPRRRVTTRDESRQIKKGEIPERFSDPKTPEEKHRASQVDTDARWAKKGGETHFGFKDHVVADAATKLIVAHEVTPANVHDSQKLVDVVPKDTEKAYDDAGYVGEDIDKALKEKCPGIEHFTCAKAFRNRPLTNEQKQTNQGISKIRARVEHVFGRMTYCMGGMTVRCIGLARAKCQIALRDLAYNMQRYVTLARYHNAPILCRQ
jgi:IS5 family transposase